MTDGLAGACADLETWLPVAAGLLAEPDAGGMTARGQTGSRPPWNAAVAYALLGAHAGIRRLAAQLHAEVTGQPPPVMGGSDGVTIAAIRRVAALGVNASPASVADAAWQVTGYVTPIKQLRAVDLDERFHRVHGVACYHCGNTMLRLGERSARVACLRYGACFDHDGQHPTGFVTYNHVDEQAMVAWADGCNQYADVQPQ